MDDGGFPRGISRTEPFISRIDPSICSDRFGIRVRPQRINFQRPRPGAEHIRFHVCATLHAVPCHGYVKFCRGELGSDELSAHFQSDRLFCRYHTDHAGHTARRMGTSGHFLPLPPRRATILPWAIQFVGFDCSLGKSLLFLNGFYGRGSKLRKPVESFFSLNTVPSAPG